MTHHEHAMHASGPAHAVCVPALHFKATYRDAIASGEKNDTIRAKRPDLCAGDVVTLYAGQHGLPPIGRARVESVRRVRRLDLATSRRRELVAIYGPDLPAAFWRIVWTSIDDRSSTSRES